MRAALLAVAVGCGGPGPRPGRAPEPCPPPAAAPATTPGASPLQFTGDVPRNLVFLSLDTLRRDHVGAYGAVGLTPYLDALAATGVVFDDHLQCSNWTLGSGRCTLHGRTNLEIGQIPRVPDSEPLPGPSPTLASALSAAGWSTILVSSNNFIGPIWGSGTGYDVFETVEPNGLAVGQEGLDLLGAAVADGADPWFLHLHFMEPHEPYDPEPVWVDGRDALDPWPTDLTEVAAVPREQAAWAGYTDAERALLLAHLAALYEGDVRMLDARLGWTLEQLGAAGYLDDALVVVWNDHGEQFFERGHLSHAYELNAEENDGVLIVAGPGLVPGRFGGPTWSVDLAPSLLDLLGVPVPPEMTGVPFGRAPAERPRYGEAVARSGAVQSVVVGGWKLHYDWDGAVSLFDRSVDPAEATDRYTAAEARDAWCALRPVTAQLAALVPDLEPVTPVGLPDR